MIKKILNYYNLESDSITDSFPVSFYPTPDRYIIYQTGSHKKSQIYDHSLEVISLIRQQLDKQNIKIIQIGDAEDPSVGSDFDLRGKITLYQIAFLIKNALLCVSSNSLTSKLCRCFNIDLIFLGSNFPSKSIVPDCHNISYLEPELKTVRWTYKDNEEIKLINSLKPEKIAEQILFNLNIQPDFNIDTLFMGEKYGHQIIDFIPDCSVSFEKNKKVNVRLDIVFNEEVMQNLSKRNAIFITTDRPVDISKINVKNLVSVSYFCSDSVDIDFVKKCIKNKITIYVISTQEEFLNKIRFDLLGICEVYKKINQKPLDFSKNCDIVFKSSRLYVGKNSVFPSLYHYKNNLQISSENSSLSEEMQSNDDFLESINSMYIYKI